MNKYIKPKVSIEKVYTEYSLLEGSNEKPQVNSTFSKRHNFSFYDWEEESDNSLPRSKSVWDD